MKLCKKCERELVGRQQSYCSGYCSKLHLKSEYRKRNADRLRQYHRDYRARRAIGLGIPEWKTLQKRRLGRPDTQRKRLLISELGGKCRICGTRENLTLNHIRPQIAEGGHQREN